MSTSTSPTKQVRMGIIGLGLIAEYHMRSLHTISGVSIVAVSDVNPNRLQAIGEQLQLPASKRYAHYEALIRDPEVDAILSLTPNDVHFDIIRIALEEHKAVLAEKPLTLTWEEADQLKKLYTANPVPLLVHYKHRYGAAFQYTKQLLDEQKLGKIYNIQFRYLMDAFAPYRQHPYTWRHNLAKAGSGVVGDTASHIIDLARFLVGEFKSVAALLHTITPERFDPITGLPVKVNVEDLAAFHGIVGDNTVGTFITHKNAIGIRHDIEVDIYGELGTLHASLNNPESIRIVLRDLEHPGAEYETWAVPVIYNHTAYEDFVELARGKSVDRAPLFEDGYKNQWVLEKILQSWKENGRLVEM
ncbi:MULTISPECIES: Gfo/Idh/MocA family protein [Paenibacillus]|uniref:Gfo/Idh/MocA family protein n=1 Tax=Paenibacillus TaxID=44249 RepID=UPI00096CD815|nr:Gfo/Idh/MocA family oxidoreductase [Paenibacillus peoriae]OMF31881.1 dehydrogenase [Paenibacillus peoriae]